MAAIRAYRTAPIAAVVLAGALGVQARAEEGRFTGGVKSVKSDVFGFDVKTKILTRTVYLRFDPEKTASYNLIEAGERIAVRFDPVSMLATRVSRPAGDAPAEQAVRAKPVDKPA